MHGLKRILFCAAFNPLYGYGHVVIVVFNCLHTGGGMAFKH